MSLLACCKIGRGGGRYRARQKLARASAVGAPKPRPSSGRTSSPAPGPLRQTGRRRFPLHEVVVGLWLALSLLLVAYATIKGEVALAEFDRLDLVAIYSSAATSLLEPTP